MHKPIKILIVDDHALVREGIRALVAMHEGIEVVGEAEDGLQAIEMTGDLDPDVVLMDIAMPRYGGLEATLEIRKKHKDAKILILSQYDDPQYLDRFLKAGVSGYILKKALGSELVSAIRAVAAGESYLHPSLTANVIERYLSKGSPKKPAEPVSLTSREQQILKLLAEGNSHKEIASILDISVKTVVAHQSNISEKLDLHTRAGLIKYAFQHGIVRAES